MKELVLGLDIGGTNTVYGLVDEESKIWFRDEFRTAIYDSPTEYVAYIAQVIQKELDQHSEYTLKGIGIGAPNGNVHDGTINYPPNLNWKGIIPLSDYFKGHFNVPVILTNDANATAIGEMVFGHAKGLRDFVVITLGTGLGSGIVVNGELVYGHDGFAGELGHTLVYLNEGRQCGCGRRGCLETYVSARGLRRTVFELLAKQRDESNLRDISYNEMHSERIYNAALEGDPIARQAFEYTGKILGLKLADTVAHTSPQAIFLYGGLAKAGDLILKPTQYHYEKNVMNLYKNKVDFYLSELNEKDGALIGPAALIWDYL